MRLSRTGPACTSIAPLRHIAIDLGAVWTSQEPSTVRCRDRNTRSALQPRDLLRKQAATGHDPSPRCSLWRPRIMRRSTNDGVPHCLRKLREAVVVGAAPEVLHLRFEVREAELGRPRHRRGRRRSKRTKPAAKSRPMPATGFRRVVRSHLDRPPRLPSKLIFPSCRSEARPCPMPTRALLRSSAGRPSCSVRSCSASRRG